MKVSFYKIQSSFAICVVCGVRELRLSDAGVNTAVLLHFVLMTQTRSFELQVQPVLFVKMSQSSARLASFSTVSVRLLRNLLQNTRSEPNSRTLFM
jgi:hypothetical protein